MNAPMQVQPPQGGEARQPGVDPSAAGNMMAGREAADNPDKGGQDPVIEALKTIQVAISALQSKGDPKAQAIGQAFQALIAAFKGAGAPEQEAPGEAPEGQPMEKPAAPPMERGSRPMGENQSSGTRPVL